MVSSTPCMSPVFDWLPVLATFVPADPPLACLGSSLFVDQGHIESQHCNVVSTTVSKFLSFFFFHF